MVDLLDKVNSLISNNSVLEVLYISGSKVKEAASLLKPRKGDVSGGFTSDALLNAPDIMFSV